MSLLHMPMATAFYRSAKAIFSETRCLSLLRELKFFDAEYDRAKVPGSLKALLSPPLLNEVQNKGTQGVRARYHAELPPFIPILRHPGRPVTLGMEFSILPPNDLLELYLRCYEGLHREA